MSARATEAQTPWDESALRALFDPATGALDRRALSDPDIYQLELKQIFGRGWHFMCHDSHLKETGDYLITYIGEDQVIVVRDGEGAVNVLLNTCRHRGNALCRAELGRAKSFVCSYHGWNYGLDGALIGVPGLKTYYGDALDRSALGLKRAAKVESFRGFWFATLSPEAPSLWDYLGEVGRAGLSMMHGYGEVEAVNGVQKNVVDCNWKIAADNLSDWYHVIYSHISTQTAGYRDLKLTLSPNDQLVMLGDHGHSISGPAAPADLQARLAAMTDAERDAYSDAQTRGVPRLRPREADAHMGPAGVRSNGHPGIFANLWVALNGVQLSLRHPRGPNATEIWWFTFMPKDSSPAYRRRATRVASHLFGPAGFLEQDDGENWSQSTRTARTPLARDLPHTLQMGLGRDRVVSDPATGQRYIDTQVNEHGQRWFYRSWVEWLCARDWSELSRNTAAAPEGVI